MNPTKIVLLGTICLGLTACSTMRDPGVTVVNRNTPVAVPNTPPTPMNLGTVEWRVLNLEELKRLVVEMEARGSKDAVIYVLDKGNYEVLSMNLAEMRRYIEDQTAQGKQYREAFKINAGTDEPKPEKPKKKKRFGIF